ncbi:MAG TPA: hypothetical protein VM345_19435 [Acidimicrobiales bacterium]|jgi:hypothetical protein|nr:hypothetical protein [Acidimicrobiales bacterium]
MRTRIATTALFVAGFGVGAGGHQAVVADGTRRTIAIVVGVFSALVLVGLAIELRRERPGAHARRS